MKTQTVRVVVVDRPGRRVELVGDAGRVDGQTHPWQRGRLLHEDPPGTYAVEVDLPAGVYRAKLRLDALSDHEEWRLVPGWFVDRVEGVDNSVVVIDGRADTVLFANDHRHVQLRDGVLHVVCDRSAFEAQPLQLVVNQKRTPLVVVGEAGGRHLLRAEMRLPPAGDSGAVFGFDDDISSIPCLSGSQVSRDGNPATRRWWPLPAPTQTSAPHWLRMAVFYGLFVDRWHRGSTSPPDPRSGSRRRASNPSVFYGGDLPGITEGLDHIASLGVTALVLTPLHLSHTPHRYDAVDPLTIDERLGGRAALQLLVHEAHKRGLKVVVDAAVTHVNEQHAAFQDVLKHQGRSAFASWFRIHQFPIRARDALTYEHYYRCPELPWLNLNGPAADHALAAMDVVLECGVDGLRFDAMDDAPDAFWRLARAHARQSNPDVLLLGEVVGDDVWRRADDDGCDVVTDFRIRDALLDFATGTQRADQLVRRLMIAAHRSGASPPWYRLAFIDNHDTVRALSRLGRDVVAFRRLLAVLFALDQTVWITAGTEAHLSVMDHDTPLDDAWGDRLPMPPLLEGDATTRALLQRLAHMRRETRDEVVAVVVAHDHRLVLRRGAWIVDVGHGEPLVAKS